MVGIATKYRARRWKGIMEPICQNGDEHSDSRRLAKLLLDTAAALRSELDRQLFRDRMSESRFWVLQSLRDRGDAGMSQKELAEAVSLAESSVCGLVDRMRKDGLLFQFRSKLDRRKNLLMLSREGLEQYNIAQQERNRCLERLLGEVPAEIAEAVCEGLRQIEGAIADVGSPGSGDPSKHGVMTRIEMEGCSDSASHVASQKEAA